MPSSRILSIDLTRKESDQISLSEDSLHGYLGGRGLGAKLLWEGVKPGCNPLGPENPLILTAGLTQGTKSLFSSRSFITTKSPLTGIYLSSNAGGQAAAELRRAGFYALMIRGKASSPIYLFIKDQDIEFRPASHLWGMKTIEAQQRIAEEIGNPRASIMVIGPAGEKLVKIACVLTEGDKRRTFSRGGSGAVFGSKNLKGVAILGTSSIEIQDQKSFQKTQREIGGVLRANRDWAKNRRLYGTGGSLHLLNEMNLLPTRNWQKGSFPGANQIGPFFVRRKWTMKDISCGPFCPAPCGKISLVPSGEFAGATSAGPEYETLYALGSNCGVDRFDAIIHAEQLCDELGLGIAHK